MYFATVVEKTTNIKTPVFALIKIALIRIYHLHMCNRVMLLLGKLPQWNRDVNETIFQEDLRSQTGLISLRVSRKCTLWLKFQQNRIKTNDSQ